LAPRHLHSFPTRRSSDLDACRMIITPRRSLALALVAATAVTWFHHVTMAGAATAEVHIRSVDVHAFPQVTVTASITGRGVSASEDRKSTRLNSSHLGISY